MENGRFGKATRASGLLAGRSLGLCARPDFPISVDWKSSATPASLVENIKLSSQRKNNLHSLTQSRELKGLTLSNLSGFFIFEEGVKVIFSESWMKAAAIRRRRVGFCAPRRILHKGTRPNASSQRANFYFHTLLCQQGNQGIIYGWMWKSVVKICMNVTQTVICRLSETPPCSSYK